MYTIVMKADKTLVATQKIKIYQRENAVDKIQFLLPVKYGEIELEKFLVTLKYVDPTDTVHSETLVRDEEIYKEEFLRYTLPFTTALTRNEGDISVWLTAVRVDPENEVQYVLHTGEHNITVSPLKDLYYTVPGEALEAIDQKMVQLSGMVEALDKLGEEFARKQVDDLSINENGLLQVSTNKVPHGDGVYINAPVEDIDSNPHDGVIDLDDLRTVNL